MAGKSISHCQGKGSLSHNNRDFKAKNVDSSRTNDNITFIKQPIAEAYDECFSAAVHRYNEKQSRSDRQIKTSYFENLFNHLPSNSVITSSDKRKSFYEDLIQIGTKEDTGCCTAEGKIAVECLTEYFKSFSERNPNMYVFNAVLHQDEATPHLHLDYIPIGHYNRGVDIQNGLAQALKEQGYIGKDAISHWREAERKVLEDICISHGIEISEPKKSRGYSFSVDEYKERQDRINELDNQISEKETEYTAIQNQTNELQEQINALTSSRMPLGQPRPFESGKQYSERIQPSVSLLRGSMDELKKKTDKLEKKNQQLEADKRSPYVQYDLSEIDEEKSKYIVKNLLIRKIPVIYQEKILTVQQWAADEVQEISKTYKPSINKNLEKERESKKEQELKQQFKETIQKAKGMSR